MRFLDFEEYILKELKVRILDFLVKLDDTKDSSANILKDSGEEE